MFELLFDLYKKNNKDLKSFRNNYRRPLDSILLILYSNMIIFFLLGAISGVIDKEPIAAWVSLGFFVFSLILASIIAVISIRRKNNRGKKLNSNDMDKYYSLLDELRIKLFSSCLIDVDNIDKIKNMCNAEIDRRKCMIERGTFFLGVLGSFIIFKFKEVETNNQILALASFVLIIAITLILTLLEDTILLSTLRDFSTDIEMMFILKKTK